jgi:hypothetical protein
MAVGFDYDLEEVVNFGGRDISLRQAILDHAEARKRVSGIPLPPMWFREQGKQPGSFEAHHMDALADAIPLDKLNAENDVGAGDQS